MDRSHFFTIAVLLVSFFEWGDNSAVRSWLCAASYKGCSYIGDMIGKHNVSRALDTYYSTNFVKNTFDSTVTIRSQHTDNRPLLCGNSNTAHALFGRKTQVAKNRFTHHW